MSTQKEKPQGKPPVEKKAPAKASYLDDEKEVKTPLTLAEITEALGTMEDAREQRKILQDRAAAAKALEEQEKSLANAQASQIRQDEGKSRYAKAQTDLLRNQRLLAEEFALKTQREAAEKEVADKEAREETERQAAEALEIEKAAKVRRDAGEYEPLRGEQLEDCFLDRSALDVGSVGVILRIIPLKKEGGKPIGVPQHLFIPNVKPSNGLLRRSIR